jgi:phosphatidylserine/phosphatidylglycerophosphate/cardiolipin synthase-like enzyme
VPADAPSWVPSVVRLNQQLASTPLTGRNHVELLPDYQESIDGARRDDDPVRRLTRPGDRARRDGLLVDDMVGFTGSLNLTHPSYNKLKNLAAGRERVELWLRVEGPVVGTIDALFAADWALETSEVLNVWMQEVDQTPHSSRDSVDVSAQLVPSGPGFEEKSNLRLFTTLIYNAHRRVSLTSPYLRPGRDPALRGDDRRPTRP